jgi:hypothetical protein
MQKLQCSLSTKRKYRKNAMFVWHTHCKKRKIAKKHQCIIHKKAKRAKNARCKKRKTHSPNVTCPRLAGTYHFFDDVNDVSTPTQRQKQPKSFDGDDTMLCKRVVTKDRRYITQVSTLINLISSSLTRRQNKLECSSLASIFCLVYICERGY